MNKSLLSTLIISMILIITGCDNLITDLDTLVNKNNDPDIVVTFDNLPSEIYCGTSWIEAGVIIEANNYPEDNINDCPGFHPIEQGQMNIWPGKLLLDYHNTGKAISRVEIDLYDYCGGCSYAEFFPGLADPVGAAAVETDYLEMQTISLSTDEAETVGLAITSFEATVLEIRLYDK